MMCTANVDKMQDLVRFLWMAGVKLHPFPTVKTGGVLRGKWINAVRRDNKWKPNADKTICSKHLAGVMGPPTSILSLHCSPAYNGYGCELRGNPRRYG